MRFEAFSQRLILYTIENRSPRCEVRKLISIQLAMNVTRKLFESDSIFAELGIGAMDVYVA